MTTSTLSYMVSTDKSFPKIGKSSSEMIELPLAHQFIYGSITVAVIFRDGSQDDYYFGTQEAAEAWLDNYGCFISEYQFTAERNAA